MNINANNPYYVPKYQTLPSGETSLNKLGMTQQEILERNFKLEVGTRLREALRPGSPAKSAQERANLEMDIIRQLMAEQEEGSLAMNVLQMMFDRLQGQPSNGPMVDITGEVIEPPALDVKA